MSSSSAPVRKSSRQKREPDRFTYRKRVRARAPVPALVEDSDGDDFDRLFDRLTIESDSDDMVDDFSSENEVDEMIDESESEPSEAERDEDDDDEDYVDMSDDSDAPLRSDKSSSSSSSSSASSSSKPSRKRSALVKKSMPKKKPRVVLGPKPQRDQSKQRDVPVIPSTGSRSKVQDPQTWEDYHDRRECPPPGLKPPIVEFKDIDPQSDFPKKDSDVSGEIVSKLEFTRSNKKPELPDEPELTGFRDDLKELDEKCRAATDEKDFPFDEVFFAYYNKGMKLHAVKQTNLYFRQFVEDLEARGKPIPKRARDFAGTKLAEYERYLATMLLLALVAPGYSYQDCWKNDSVRKNQLVMDAMKLPRFKGINKFLHFADNKHHDGTKLYKIKTMYDLFVKNLKTVHGPLSPHLSFDEFVSNCQSKCSFTVFMPLKRHPRGIRFYPVVDSERLTVNLHIDSLEKQESAHPSFGPIDNLTAHCLEPFLDKGYRVTFDQGFTNPGLLSWLHAHKTPACGTMRTDRKGVPEQLKWGDHTYKPQQIANEVGRRQVQT